MKDLDIRTMANLDFVLEEACRLLPHGGNHEFRKAIGKKLINSARKGNATLAGLTAVAREALSEEAKRKSA